MSKANTQALIQLGSMAGIFKVLLSRPGTPESIKEKAKPALETALYVVENWPRDNSETIKNNIGKVFAWVGSCITDDTSDDSLIYVAERIWADLTHVTKNKEKRALLSKLTSSTKALSEYLYTAEDISHLKAGDELLDKLQNLIDWEDKPQVCKLLKTAGVAKRN